MKRRWQRLYGRVWWLRRRRGLSFLWYLFLSCICLQVFWKDVVIFLDCSSVIDSFCSFRLSFNRNHIFPQQGVSGLILKTTAWGSTCALARCKLRVKYLLGRRISDFRARFPAHWSQWRVIMVSRLFAFARRWTSLFVILSSHVKYTGLTDAEESRNYNSAVD